MVSADKESGMYRFMKSQGVGSKQIITGKVFGLWGITILLFLPFVLAGLSLLLYTSADGSDLMRFGLLCLVWLLYFGVMVHLTIGVSELSNSTGSAMVILLSLWIVSTLLVPRLVTNVASSVHPVPNTNELYQAIRTDLMEGIDGHNPYSEHSAAFRDSVLTAHGVDDVADLPFNFSGLMLQESEEFEKKIYDHHLAKIDAIHQRQIGLFAFSSVLSPTIATRLVSMAIAGTDIHHYNHFFDEAEEYRINLMRELNMDLKIHAVGDRAPGYTSDADFFAQNASFTYQKPDRWVLNSGQWTPLVLSFIWLMASILLVRFTAGRKENDR